jgi:hypothetical protein
MRAAIRAEDDTSKQADALNSRIDALITAR